MVQIEKSPVKEIKIRSALNLNFKMLQFLGYWPPEDSSMAIRILYVLFSICIIGFFFWTYVVSEIISIALSFGDLEKVVDATFLFLTHLAQICKMFYFFKNNKRIKDLANSLDREIFIPRSQRQYKMIIRAMNSALYTFLPFIIMAWMTCALWAIFPLIDDGGEHSKSLPLSGYYPFDTNPSPYFELVYSYQVISNFINASSNICKDTVASGFMALVCGQLDVLNDSLKNIKSFAIESLQAKTGEEVDLKNELEMYSPELEKEMDTMLLHCVDHHKNILQMAAEINELFNVSILSQFFVSSIIICVTMFELTMVSILSLKFLSMVLYQGCMLVEIILYCWFGNEIMLKSSELSSSAYESDWINCRLPYKKKILFIMVRTKEPMKLYAGNFFTLSVETFVNILRSSWSYFAVLNRVHQE